MTYLFQNRLDRLGSRMKQLNYEEIVITDGTTPVTIERASPVFTNESQLIDNAIVSVSKLAFAVDVADLGVYSPRTSGLRPGLRITRPNGDVFVVVSPNHDDNCYQYTTSSRLRVLINVAQVG